MCAINVFHGPGQTPDTIVGRRVTGLIEAVDDFQGQPAKAEKEKPCFPLLGRAVEAEVQSEARAIYRGGAVGVWRIDDNVVQTVDATLFARDG